MRAVLELRVPESNLDGLPASVGVRLGDGAVRKIETPLEGDLYDELARRNAEISNAGGVFHYGWQIRRFYDRDEIEAAELFELHVDFPLEVSVHADRVVGCDRVSGRWSVVRTLDGHVLIRDEVAEAFTALSGASVIDLDTVNCAHLRAWRRLAIEPVIDVVSPTRFADGPLSDSNDHEDPTRAIAGLNIVTEIHVRESDWRQANADIAQTRQRVGEERGDLRPRQLILLSQRGRRILESAAVRGYSLEVAYLVDD